MNNRSSYSSDWFDTIRPAILRRDNYRCTVCNATQRSVGYYNASDQFVICDAFMQDWCARTGQATRTIYLQIAHLDQDPSNNSEMNLKTFCPRHHLQYDAKFNALKKLARRKR